MPKKSNNTIRNIIIIIIIIALIAESTVLYITKLKVKDQKFFNEQKTNKTNDIKSEMIQFDKAYDKLMNQLETFGDYKRARLRNEQSLKDSLLKEKSRREDLILRIAKANSMKNEDRVSVIASQSDISKIEEWSKCSFLKLCYRGSRDGIDAKVFHEKCDGYWPTVILIHAKMGKIFGGFTRATWNGEGVKYDTTAFLFSLSYNKVYPVFHYLPAITTGHKILPCFGINDIVIDPESSSIAHFLRSYFSGDSKIKPDDNNKRTFFELSEIEVFVMGVE